GPPEGDRAPHRAGYADAQLFGRKRAARADPHQHGVVRARGHARVARRQRRRTSRVAPAGRRPGLSPPEWQTRASAISAGTQPASWRPALPPSPAEEGVRRALPSTAAGRGLPFYGCTTRWATAGRP